MELTMLVLRIAMTVAIVIFEIAIVRVIWLLLFSRRRNVRQY